MATSKAASKAAPMAKRFKSLDIPELVSHLAATAQQDLDDYFSKPQPPHDQTSDHEYDDHNPEYDDDSDPNEEQDNEDDDDDQPTDPMAQDVANLNSVLAAVGGDINPQDQSFHILHKYSDFCATFHTTFRFLTLEPISTQHFTFSTYILSIAFFLGWLRMDGQEWHPANIKVKTKRLRNIFYELRAAMHQATALTSADLPEYLHNPIGQNHYLNKLFNEWATQDPTKPAQAQGFITKTHVQEFCLHILQNYFLHPGPATFQTQIDILWALLLRVQSGTNTRTNNCTTILWKHLAFNEQNQPQLTVSNTKGYNLMTPTRKCRTKPQSIFTLTDIISQTLLFIWYRWFGPPTGKTDGDDYIFPRVNKHNFNFDKSLTNQNHNTATTHLADCLSLWADQQHRDTFTSQAIRYGAGWQNEMLEREVRQATNPHTGRSRASHTNTYYAIRADCMTTPGPLFSDAATILQHYEHYMSEALRHYKDNLLCNACGMPECECPKCANMNKKHSCHECWLKAHFQTTRQYKPPKTKGYTQSQEVSDQIAAKWKEYGVLTVPQWQYIPHIHTKHSMGGYYWPEPNLDDFAPPGPDRGPVLGHRHP